LWGHAKPAHDAHPYLQRKRIKPHGARLDDKNRLLIPLAVASEIHSIQFIEPDGQKHFLTAGRKRGCYFLLGEYRELDSKPLCMAEGFATAASIYEATGYPTVCAFDAGNLLPVVKWIHDRRPDVRVILCADDDVHTIGNLGLTKANQAARAVNGLLAIPD